MLSFNLTVMYVDFNAIKIEKYTKWFFSEEKLLFEVPAVTRYYN